MDEGKKLVQCISAISAYGREIDSLCETLNDQITQRFSRDDLPCKPVGKMVSDLRRDETEWVCTDVAWSLPLAGKKARIGRPEMYLGYQISLAGDGMAFVGNEEPLLHLCLWESDIDFNEVYMGYPLDEDPAITIKDNRLIVWEGPGTTWKKDCWTFSIRLLTLDSSNALLERVINPAIALLNETPVTSSLPDDLLGLVLYSDINFLRYHT